MASMCIFPVFLTFMILLISWGIVWWQTYPHQACEALCVLEAVEIVKMRRSQLNILHRDQTLRWYLEASFSVTFKSLTRDKEAI